MKRIIVGLVLSAAAAASAEPPPSEAYRAFGTNPEWSLVVENGRITFSPAGSASISDPAPERTRDEIGWRYETPSLTVQAFDGGCEDEASGRRYSDAVWVMVDGRELSGCGGAEYPPGSLLHTAWMISAIGDTELRGPELAIDFHDGRFISYTGCRRIGGTFTQTGDTLVMTVTGGTTQRCGEPVGGCERRLLQILERPMKVSFPDRKSLLLTSDAGAIRLRIPAVDEPIFETRVAPCPAAP